jgi:hypothetical protein
MTDTQPSRQYRFSQRGGEEIETKEFNGDDAAEAYGRDLSKTRATPIIIHRHGNFDWEYVTETDERP